MSQPTIEAYGFELPLVNKPANLQDAIDAFGADKVFEWQERYRLYHIVANGARDAVLEAIEKVTGIKPKTKTVTKTDKEGKSTTVEVQDEGDGAYVNRATAEATASTFGGDSNAFKAAMTDALKDAIIDYAKEPERRSAGPKKPGVQVTKRAQALSSKGADAVAKTIEKLKSYVPEALHPKDVSTEPDGTYSVESIAKWLMAFDKHEAEESAKREAALAA